MLIYSCKICNFESKYKKNYNEHLLTKKHINITKECFVCKDCTYSTKKLVNYQRHLSTQKHLKFNPVKNEEQEKTREIIRLLMEKIEILEKKNDLNTNKLKEAGDQNTNKIVREARNMKSSVLTMLNTHFKDTPSIEYIEQKPFYIALEEEYEAKINDDSNKLFMRIFSDYNKKKLIKTLSDLILKFVKKDNQKFQSVFNIDSARDNFATKINDFWLNDKKGLQLRKFTVDKVIKYMIEILDIFRLRLVKIRQDNLIKSTTERSDYLMENQTILLKVVSFLTNSNTHTKIITQLSPKLRCDERLLVLKQNI
jgi:hypothetical protein